MPIALPNGLQVFVFGSALRGFERAADLDLLFLYDSSVIPSNCIYELVNFVKNQMSNILRLPVHPLVLSRTEEAAERFLFRYESQPLDEWVRARTQFLGHEVISTAGYAQMSTEEMREAEAEEWSEALLMDIADEA